MNVKVILTLLCLGWVCVSANAGEANPNPQEEGDIVYRNDGKPGPPGAARITQDNYVQVILKRGSAEVKIPSFAVKEILYADRDVNYDEGVKKRDDGRFTTAALKFDLALENMAQVKWAAEYCNYGMGNALYQAGYLTGYKGKSGKVYQPAAVYFKKALEANPKSRFMPDIVVKLPVCLAEEGKLDEADSARADAEDRIKKFRDETIKVGDGYGEIADRASAQLAIADARIAEKKASTGKGDLNIVLDKWQSARSRCLRFEELQAEAIDGVLRTMIAKQDFPGAQGEAQAIVDKYQKESDPKLLAQLPSAFTTLGKANLGQAAAYEAKGQKLQAHSAYAEARWDFLNVVAQYFDNDEDVASSHYFAGVCYDKLTALEPDGHDRAIREWKQVLAQFPKSVFAERAKKDLEDAGVIKENKEAKPEKGKSDKGPAAPPAKKKP